MFTLSYINIQKAKQKEVERHKDKIVSQFKLKEKKPLERIPEETKTSSGWTTEKKKGGADEDLL